MSQKIPFLQMFAALRQWTELSNGVEGWLIVSAAIDKASRSAKIAVEGAAGAGPNLIAQAEEALARAAAAHPLTLADPEPMIRVEGYRDSAIEYVVRVWCANADYWTVYYDLMDGLKPLFDRAGVEMTYPHLNVHMVD